MPILIAPPRLRANQDDERHATWLESLYDLVFAVSVFWLVDRLTNNSTPSEFVRFVLLFLVVWWSWIGPTVYLTRFDTYDFIHQAITFGQMLAAAVLTTQIPHVFENDATVFIVSFLFIRYSLLWMYGRARWYIPEARSPTTVYLLGFGAGATLWTISLLLAPPDKYALWVIGLAIELVTPWVGQRVLRRLPVNTTHMPERFAQFNLIVFGEAVYEIIIGVGEVNWHAATVGAALLLFCLTVVVAGRYFVYTERRSDKIKHTLGSGQAQIYAHLPFALGVATISASAPRVLAEAVNPSLTLSTLWLFVGGAALCSLAAILLYLATTDTPEPAHINQRTLVLGTTLLVGVVGRWLPPLIVLTAVLGVAFIGLVQVSRLR